MLTYFKRPKIYNGRLSFWKYKYTNMKEKIVKLHAPKCILNIVTNLFYILPQLHSCRASRMIFQNLFCFRFKSSVYDIYLTLTAINCVRLYSYSFPFPRLQLRKGLWTISHLLRFITLRFQSDLISWRKYKIKIASCRDHLNTRWTQYIIIFLYNTIRLNAILT